MNTENTSFEDAGQAQHPDNKPKFSGRVLVQNEYRPLDDIRIMLGASPETVAMWLKAGLVVSELGTRQKWALVADVMVIRLTAEQRAKRPSTARKRKIERKPKK